MIKKHKLHDYNESNVAGTSSGSITHSTVSVSSKTVVCQYNEDYCPSNSFHLENSNQVPSVLSGVKLANQATVPCKLHTKHSHLCEMPNEYFRMLIAGQTCYDKQRTKITTISDKAQEASYDIAKMRKKR
jgi:hypothetical protein